MTRSRAIACCLFSVLLPLTCDAQSVLRPTPSDSGGNTRFAPAVSVRELGIPEKAKRAFQRGINRIAVKDWAGSIPEFEKAIKAFGNLYEAYYKIGIARLELHQIDAAGSALRKAIELSEGKYAAAFFGLGLVLSASGQYQDAAVAVRSGLTLAPMDAGGHCTMAWILYSSRRIAEAEQSAQEAVRQDPNFAMARLMLAEIHRTQNKGAELVEDLTIYLRLDPVGPRSGRARQALEETRQALEKARKALEYPPIATTRCLQ